MNGGPMDLGMTLFLCVFLIPFVTVGIGMAGAAVMNLIGKVEVIIDEFDSYVATGFGIIRWKKRFDPREVKTVEFGTTPWQSEDGATRFIEITANRTVKFGYLLQSNRMEWLSVLCCGKYSYQGMAATRIRKFQRWLGCREDHRKEGTHKLR